MWFGHPSGRRISVVQLEPGYVMPRAHEAWLPRKKFYKRFDERGDGFLCWTTRNVPYPHEFVQELSLVRGAELSLMRALSEGGFGLCTVLLDPGSHELPGHVCFDVAAQTVQQYARQRWPPRCGEQDEWLREWPLPVGSKALQAFADRSGHDVRDLPFSVFGDDPDRHIGLWVERRTSSGVVTLSAAASRLEPRDRGEVWSLVDTPLLETSAVGTLEAKHSELAEIAKTLTRWYHETVLLKPVNRQTEKHRSKLRDQGQARYAEAREFAEARFHVSDPNSAELAQAYQLIGLDVTRQTVDNWLEDGDLPPPSG